MTLGSALAVGGLVVGRRLPDLTGTVRLLAWALIATLALIAAHVIPGLAGVLSREAAAVTALLMVAGGALMPRTAAAKDTNFPAGAPPSGDAARLLAATGCAGFVVWILAAVWTLRYHAPQGVDTLSFHLPGVARWIQSGSIWQIDELLPDLYFGNYPNSGDVLLLSTVLPWRNDFLTHFAMVPFIGLTAVATYALGRELRAPAAPAALLGVMVASVPVVVEPGLLNALPDPVMFSSFATGLVFLLRHHRSGATRDLVLAGLGLGLAFGTKWYGVSSVIVVVVVWAVARLLAGTGIRAVARQTGGIAGLVTLAGGVWLVRNLFLSGNPVFPQKIAPFGITIFDAPPDPLRELAGFTIAGYFDQPAIWVDYLDHQYRVAAAAPVIVLFLGTLAAAMLLFRRHRRGQSFAGGGTVALVCLPMMVLLVAAYVVTPASALGPEDMPILAGANVRYVVPAFIVAAGLTGWAIGLAPRWAQIATLVVALAATVDGLRTSHLTGGGTVYASFAVGAIAVLASYRGRTQLAGVLSRMARLDTGRRLRAGWAGVAAVVVILAVLIPVGDRYQRQFNADRYLGFDPTLDWVNQKAPTGQSIGLTGVWTLAGLAPIYPAFGPRLGNEVVYHGPFVREIVRRYRSRKPFVSSLRKAGYDLLFIGRGPTYEQYRDGGTPPPVQRVVKEEAWARAAGYVEITRSDRLILLRAGR